MRKSPKFFFAQETHSTFSRMSMIRPCGIGLAQRAKIPKSGKSTLLNILGTLDQPNKGTLEIAGKDVALLDDESVSRLRCETIGFVFQFHHLLPEFTIVENLMIPSDCWAGVRGPLLIGRRNCFRRWSSCQELIIDLTPSPVVNDSEWQS